MALKYLLVTPTEEQIVLIYYMYAQKVIIGGHRSDIEWMNCILEDHLCISFDTMLELPCASNKIKLQSSIKKGIEPQAFFRAVEGMQNAGIVCEKVSSIGRAFN